MSDETTLVDKLNNNERPDDAKITRGRLILRNLSGNHKELLKTGGITLGALLTGGGLYAMFDSGFKNAADALNISNVSNEKEERDDLSPQDENGIIIYTEACFADVSDDMSFQEAFASAREQTGQGGFFEWKGKVYNTYYQEEWEKMTNVQHDEYWSSVVSASEYDTLELIEGGNTEASTGDDVEESEENHSEDTTVDLESRPEPNPPPVKPDLAGEESSDIEPQDIDASLEEPQSSTSIEPEVVRPVVGKIDVNSDNIPEAIAIDSDHDGYADAIAIDEDGDGYHEVLYADIDEDEDLDIIVIDHDKDGFLDETAEETSATISMDQFIIIEDVPPSVSDDMDIAIDEDLPDLEDTADVDDLI